MSCTAERWAQRHASYLILRGRFYNFSLVYRPISGVFALSYAVKWDRRRISIARQQSLYLTFARQPAPLDSTVSNSYIRRIYMSPDMWTPADAGTSKAPFDYYTQLETRMAELTLLLIHPGTTSRG